MVGKEKVQTNSGYRGGLLSLFAETTVSDVKSTPIETRHSILDWDGTIIYVDPFGGK